MLCSGLVEGESGLGPANIHSCREGAAGGMHGRDDCGKRRRRRREQSTYCVLSLAPQQNFQSPQVVSLGISNCQMDTETC